MTFLLQKLFAQKVSPHPPFRAKNQDHTSEHLWSWLDSCAPLLVPGVHCPGGLSPGTWKMRIPARPEGRSSPTSHGGTGVAELHPGAPTRPGRRTRTHPPRSPAPARAPPGRPPPSGAEGRGRRGKRGANWRETRARSWDADRLGPSLSLFGEEPPPRLSPQV